MPPLREKSGFVRPLRASPPHPSTADCDVVVSHLLAASRRAVFDAWTDPRRFARWWGPRAVATPVADLDARPGGAYRVVMRSADAVDYPLTGVYLEVVPERRLVYTVALDEHPVAWFALLNAYRGAPRATPLEAGVVTVTFEEEGGATRLTVRTRFASARDRDAMLRMGMVGGWTESLERLEEEVAPGRRAG